MNSGAPVLRTWLAAAVGVAVAVLATSLGNWQTRRGDAKAAIEAVLNPDVDFQLAFLTEKAEWPETP